MTRYIYKYPIPVEDRFELSLPQGSEVLTVQVQRDAPQIWALVDPERPPEARRFRLAGTGHPITEQASLGRYVSTFQMLDGQLVFHVFELTEQ